MQNGRTFRVSVDIGGTFTDIVLIGSEGSVQTKKVSSTPDNYGRGIVPTPVFYGDNDTLVEIDKKAARAARLALPGVGGQLPWREAKVYASAMLHFLRVEGT